MANRVQADGEPGEDSSEACATPEDCDDGIYCNGVETCEDDTCQAGARPDCADAVSCTVDVCDEATQACVSLPDDGRRPLGGQCDPALGCASVTLPVDAAGLVGEWTLKAGLGKDSSGNDNHGSVAGSSLAIISMGAGDT